MKFGSLVFLEIAKDDSLEQFLTTSRGKTYKVLGGDQIWAKWTEIGSKISFLAIFSSLVDQFSLKLYRMIAWNNILPVEVKHMKKDFASPELGS